MIVYTVIFNDYDILMAPMVRPEGVRYVCLTDRTPPDSEGWEIQLVDLPHSRHPFAQRWHKILSHRVFPDADVSLYLDGNLQLQVDPLLVSETYLKESDIALFKHPERTGVYEELEACARLGKDRPQILADVADRFDRAGMPKDGYLYASGLILRRHSDPVIELNEVWMEELVKTSTRDQPALGFAFWKTGIQPATIKENIWQSDIVKYSPHKSQQLLTDRRYLFLCGNPRSGTTALCSLLNEDPHVILGMERYRRVREQLRPQHFQAQHFFEPTPRETSFLPARLIPSNQGGFHVWPTDEEALRRKWASSELAYVGDKSPFYIRQLPYLRKMFPGARFVVTLRDPISVADSYQRRALDPEDHWPAQNDYKVALEHWNQSVMNLLTYVKDFGLSDLFLVDYERFFSGEAGYLRSLYVFLDLEMEDEVERRFDEITRDWHSRVDRPRLLSNDMEREIRDNADWNGYWALKRLVPLMREPVLLSAEWHQLDEIRRTTQRHVARHRETADLARTLYSKLIQITEKLYPEVNAEVDDLWMRFWDLEEGGK